MLLYKKLLPVDFHCHGIGKFDFGRPKDFDLKKMNKILEIEGIRAVLTLSLPEGGITELEELLYTFSKGSQKGRFGNILGLSVEGPVLAKVGGTPKAGAWNPTKSEWLQIAKLGKSGLLYMVISPGMDVFDGEEYPEDTFWIMAKLLENGVMPALGHFGDLNQEDVAVEIDRICDYALATETGPIITDHLFNDMPLNFVHSWRSDKDRSKRAAELELQSGIFKPGIDLSTAMGIIPATLISNAKRGALKVCLNFDGDHVDIEVCKNTVKLVGAENVLLMTDRISSKIFGGHRVSQNAENSLLYQEDGIVAGGSQSVINQLGNMLKVGISGDEVYRITFQNPYDLLIRRLQSSEHAG
ncbi:hypothetical protein U5922_000705 (plasmid) [Aquicoccus sp. G2-2]|uniref:hypothetical protein n=1 Tax=Aquicoccus sp. G2-2 TaxID=3092120 RepID=UPI002AE01939|nr:hypothetical protein [Aquicoccus sp. G2-2]MEA1112049.1 hypothetical protein [Aquicoccus sp. G2-2]